MAHTVDEEDVSMIFDEHNTHICKSRSREDDFSSKFRCRRPADNELLAYASCHVQLRMQTMTLQTNLLVMRMMAHLIQGEIITTRM